MRIQHMRSHRAAITSQYIRAYRNTYELLSRELVSHATVLSVLTENLQISGVF